MDKNLEFLSALVLTFWAVWRIVRVVMSLERRTGPISVTQTRALLWSGLILAGVLGWVFKDAVL